MNDLITLWKRKIKFLWTFFCSIQLASLSITFAAAIVIGCATDFSLDNGLKLFIKNTLLIYPILGVGLSLLYQSTMREHEYYFYNNNACSKLDLCIFSFILASFLSFVLFKIATIWV